MCQVLQAPRFAKAKRRLPEQAQLTVDEAVRGILADPLSGTPKVGALKGVRVVKFKVGPQQLLLAYQFDPKRNLVEALDGGRRKTFTASCKSTWMRGELIARTLLLSPFLTSSRS